MSANEASPAQTDEDLEVLECVVFRYRSPSDLSNTNVQHDCLDELIWTLQRGVNHLLPYSLSLFYS